MNWSKILEIDSYPTHLVIGVDGKIKKALESSEDIEKYLLQALDS